MGYFVEAVVAEVGLAAGGLVGVVGCSAVVVAGVDQLADLLAVGMVVVVVVAVVVVAVQQAVAGLAVDLLPTAASFLLEGVGFAEPDPCFSAGEG